MIVDKAPVFALRPPTATRRVIWLLGAIVIGIVAAKARLPSVFIHFALALVAGFSSNWSP
jgi:hypothetical protein